MIRKRQFAGLVGEFNDPFASRDGFVLEAMGERFRAAQEAHDREIDELIAAGWGTTAGRNIPANWRERPGPDTEARRENYRNVWKKRTGTNNAKTTS